MSRFEHQIAADAVARETCAAELAKVLDGFEALRFGDGGIAYGGLLDGRADGGELRLLAEPHAAAGGRYRYTDPGTPGTPGTPGEPVDSAAPAARTAAFAADFTLDSWDRAGTTSVRFAASETAAPADGAEGSGSVVLRRGAGRCTVEVSGEYRGGGPRSALLAASVSATADACRWWSRAEGAAGAQGGDAPVVVRLRHRYAVAVVRVSPAPDPAPGPAGPRWLLTVRTDVRGRSWARPVLAVVLLLGRSRLRRLYARALDEMATAGAQQPAAE
ncbi:hypothetical protein [Murinocardiopsis flavida]|nr:hypothetical protein [Murinocardiopsis flavida]